MGRRHSSGDAVAVVAAALVCALTACSSTLPNDPGGAPGAAAADTSPSPGDPVEGQVAEAAYAVDPPGEVKTPLLRPDVLISATGPIPARVQRRIRHLEGVRAAMPMSVASLSAQGRTLSIASVDVDAFRRWTPSSTALADDVWERLAGGEVMVDPTVSRRLEKPEGHLTLGSGATAPQVHIGAYATLTKRINAVVTRPLGERLGMPRDNAMLVSTGELTPSVLTDRMQRILGKSASLQVLALEFDTDVEQTAVLTGTSAAEAVGSFGYTAHPSGRITPDPAWVAANIRTERVPLLGVVTCHRVMLPQLRAALTDIVDRGLSGAIHPDEFAGCYFPRFIAYDPAKGLSLHSWGIAVDLNTRGNQRGTVGEMDRRVVTVFKKWGFTWGGDWSYTDPMHFELASIVRPG